MTTQPLTRCDELPFEARAQRLAAQMFHAGHGEVKLKTHISVEKKREAGVCLLCDQQLKDTWRGCHWNDDEPATFKHIRAGHDEASINAFRKELLGDLPQGSRDETGFIGGYQVVKVVYCDSMTDQKVWDRALAIVRAKAAAVASAANSDSKDNRSERARRAATAHSEF